MFGVEYVAFQKALGDMLISKGVSVTPLRADTDKVRRAIAITDLFEKDRVRINARESQKQLIEFPAGNYDDRVDSIVYCLKLIKQYSQEKYVKKDDKYKHLDYNSKKFWKDLHNENTERSYSDNIIDDL
jgi:hypothetical protein